MLYVYIYIKSKIFFSPPQGSICPAPSIFSPQPWNHWSGGRPQEGWKDRRGELRRVSVDTRNVLTWGRKVRTWQVIWVRWEEAWNGSQETWSILAPWPGRGHNLWTTSFSSVTWAASFFLATAALLLPEQGVVNSEGLGRCEVSEEVRTGGTWQPVSLDAKTLKD